MSLTVKVAFGEENRRITVNKTITYADLTTLLTKLFNGTNIQKLEYQDDEKEWIRISTDLELEEAKRITSGNILRVRLNNTIRNATGPQAERCTPNAPGIIPDFFNLLNNLTENISVEVVGDNEWNRFRNWRSRCCPFKQQQQHGSPQSNVHYGVECDGCHQAPIVGVRYKCEKCDNFDFCDKCNGKVEHDKTHTFKTITEPQMRGGCRRWNHCNPHPQTQAQGNVHYSVACDGCGKFPIEGIRYKCEQCDNFDFCEKCNTTVDHDKNSYF